MPRIQPHHCHTHAHDGRMLRHTHITHKKEKKKLMYMGVATCGTTYLYSKRCKQFFPDFRDFWDIRGPTHMMVQLRPDCIVSPTYGVPHQTVAPRRTVPCRAVPCSLRPVALFLFCFLRNVHSLYLICITTNKAIARTADYPLLFWRRGVGGRGNRNRQRRFRSSKPRHVGLPAPFHSMQTTYELQKSPMATRSQRTGSMHPCILHASEAV